MESSMKRGKYIKIIVLIITVIILILNSILTLRLKQKYSKKVDYNSEKGFRYEQHDNYYITTSEAGFFSKSVCMAVELDDVYYSSKHKSITIILNIEIDKLENQSYMIEFDDFDESFDGENEDFGGYFYVDENMNIIPEMQSNATDDSLLQNNKNIILELAKIANDRWNLQLFSQ